MKRIILIFTALIVALLCLFQLSKYSVISGDFRIEIIFGVIAVVFFIIGLYINRKHIGEKEQPKKGSDPDKLKELGISKREYEVLLLISEGYSNKEIGEQLFVSESTIKTHVSNLLMKLDSKRRTQALQKAKALAII